MQCKAILGYGSGTYPLGHFPGHSPYIDEKNVAYIKAGLMKESLLSRRWID